jgi:hypothetical protein
MPMNSWMAKQKLRDLFSAMNSSPIPQEKDGALKMLEQSLEKAADIQAGKIALPKLNIESQPFPFRRDGQRTDRRNPMLFVNVIAMGRMAPGSPGTGNRRNKQEATFIHEEQRGAKSFGVFLYAANGGASNGQSLPRSAVKPGVPVFGNSTPFPKATARRGEDDIECQIPSELPEPPAGASKDRSDIRTKAARPATNWPNPLSVLGRALPAALEPPWGAGHWDPFPDMRGTIVRRNSWRPLASGQRPRDSFFPFSIGRWRFGAASPVLLGFHGVAYPKL